MRTETPDAARVINFIVTCEVPVMMPAIYTT